MEDIDDSPEKMNCLICDSRVGISSRNFITIFTNQESATSEVPLHLTISKLVDQELTEDSVHSLITCKKCYKLFMEYEELDRRLQEIKTEIVSNYNRTMARVQEEHLEAMKDEPMEEEVLDEENVYYFKNNKFLTIPSSDDENEKKKRKFEAVEMHLQQMHEAGEVLEEVIEIQEGDVPQISIPEPSENSQEYQEYREEEDEIIDAGAIDDSCDSDYQPNVVLEVIQNGNNELEVRHNGEDNTTALLEAAAMAEQTIQEDGSIVYNVKLEPGLPIYKDIRQVVRTESKNKKKLEVTPEFTFPIISRNGDEYTCFVCVTDEKFTGDAKAIMAHVKNDHDLRVYICDVCGDDFRKRNELSHHLDEHVATEEGDFQCEVCNRIFSNLRLFRIHKRMHYPQTKLWTCETCGKRYSSRNLLDEHINTHTGQRPYVCKHCKKDFASKYTYRAHVKTHENVRARPYNCSHCDKTFLSQQNLTQHERTHTGVKDYVCHLCGKGFVSPHNLEVHSIVHSGYKPYICRTCGKAFARKAEIRDHDRTHTGERPYQCEVCGATFSQRSNLQSHKRATHFDDKRYKCRECNKGFKRRRLLDYHVKAVHTGERPFKCNVCEATFVYPEHFKKHRRIHTGEKPFQCEVCGKAFNSRDNRNAHRFVHSDKKPYECLVCGMGFMRKPILYAHMETQGHLNDTIVVNQPRLATEEDQLVSLNMEGEMELIQEEDEKQYIFDFKKHVMLQNNEDGTIIVPEDADGQHLIIDGQYVTNGDDDSTLQDIAQLSKEQILEGEEYEEVIQESSTIQTNSGSYQLVQVTLNNSDGEEENQWVNLVRS